MYIVQIFEKSTALFTHSCKSRCRYSVSAVCIFSIPDERDTNYQMIKCKMAGVSEF